VRRQWIIVTVTVRHIEITEERQNHWFAIGTDGYLAVTVVIRQNSFDCWNIEITLNITLLKKTITN